jgi:hypothetical protein
MGFPSPTFNVLCNVWRWAAWTASYPPTVPVPSLTMMGNLAQGEKVVANAGALLQFLSVAKLSDIRDGFKEQLVTNNYRGDVVEVPAGSGRYYVCVWVDDIAKGFANEYRRASLYPQSAISYAVSTPAWPVPYP